MRKVIFRADGNSEIGLGHVIRSCALAGMLKNDFDCWFYIRQPSDYVRQEVSNAGCNLVELPVPESFEQEAIAWTQFLSGEEIVVLDGYHFDTTYQRLIKDRKCKLVCIDDIHACHFVADAVINHAGGASRDLYSCEPYTQFFLGFDYALLREGFLRAAQEQEILIRDEKNVMICFGGADPSNETMKVTKHVGENYPELHYDIIVGDAYKHLQTLKEYLSGSSIHYMLHTKLTAEEVLKIMRKSAKAICSPSSISFEYLCTKGELYLNCIADNQQSIYNYYTTNKIGFDYKFFLQPSEAFNKELVNEIFDGMQKARLLSMFQKLN